MVCERRFVLVFLMKKELLAKFWMCLIEASSSFIVYLYKPLEVALRGIDN